MESTMKQGNQIAILGIAIAALVVICKKHRADGIGKVERIKRRIYKEVSLAQNAGVDFSKKYNDLTAAEKDALNRIGHEVGWKQSNRSIASGKAYTDSYYASLRRAWNAVSGVCGIGRAYNVKDANGNVCLTWIEDAEAHVNAEQRTLEAEKRAAEARSRLRKTRSLQLVQPKAPKAPSKAEQRKAAKQAEYEKRMIFAEDFFKQWIASHRYVTDDFEMIAPDGRSNKDVLIQAFAAGELKVNTKKRQLYESGKWWDVPMGAYIDFVSELLAAWKEKEIEDGWNDNADYLDDIRTDLLNKAQLMAVSTPDGTVSGEKRFDYLPYINWIVMVKDTYHNTAADTTEITIYPVCSFETKEQAEAFVRPRQTSKSNSTTNTRTFSVKPIYEIDIASITGTKKRC